MDLIIYPSFLVVVIVMLQYHLITLFGIHDIGVYYICKCPKYPWYIQIWITHLKDLDIVVNCTLMWVPLIEEIDESHVGPDYNMGEIVFGTVLLLRPKQCRVLNLWTN